MQEIRRLERVAEKNRKLDKRSLEDVAFTPFLKLLHSSKQKGGFNVTFMLEFTWDGEIFVDREEDILVPEKESSHFYYHSQLHLRWQLGQIHSNYMV